MHYSVLIGTLSLDCAIRYAKTIYPGATRFRVSHNPRRLVILNLVAS